MYLHVYKGSPTAGGTDGILVSETISSTLSAATAVGATTITVLDATNFNTSGLAIIIGTESTTVTSVSGNVITVPSLTATHVAGETVVNTANGSNPVTIGALSNTGVESSAVTLAIRADTGYTAPSPVTIALGVDWALSLDGATWLAYGATLTFTAAITAVNTLFYAKAKSIASELPQNDSSANFIITYPSIQAA